MASAVTTYLTCPTSRTSRFRTPETADHEDFAVRVSASDCRGRHLRDGGHLSRREEYSAGGHRVGAAASRRWYIACGTQFNRRQDDSAAPGQARRCGSCGV